jgi:hypothetical protein
MIEIDIDSTPDLFGIPQQLWYDDDYPVDDDFISDEELLNMLPKLLPYVFTRKICAYFYGIYPQMLNLWRIRHNQSGDYFPKITWVVENCCDKFKTNNNHSELEFLDDLDTHIKHCRKCKKNRDNIDIQAIFPE